MAMIPPRGQAKYGDGEEYTLAPPGDPIYNVNDPKEAEIVGWRAECLEKLGFTQTAAVALGIRRDIDIHDVTRMVRAGCSPTQAAAIVL